MGRGEVAVGNVAGARPQPPDGPDAAEETPGDGGTPPEKPASSLARLAPTLTLTIRLILSVN